MSYILGLESTCDDSSLGVFDTQTKSVVWHKTYSQDKLHGQFGGVVPEIASRGHLKALPILAQQLFQEKQISLSKISCFAVSTNPGLIGSLLVGVNFMRSLAWSCNKKILGVDHLEAHVLSPLIENNQLQCPYLCFLLSGGHSIAVIVKEIGVYQVLGTTEDDALGEAFDKVAKILGFEYPGGPSIENLAKLWKGKLQDLPIPLKNRQDYNFSYSGLKTATKRLAVQLGINQEKQKLIDLKSFLQKEHKKKNAILQLAASFQKIAFESLLWNFQKITKKYSFQSFAIAGGVANNQFIKQSFQEVCKKKNINFFAPKAEYCTDNGAMIAFCAYLYQKYQIFRPLKISSKNCFFY